MRYLALGDSISIDDYTGVPGGGAASQFARLIEAMDFRNLTRDGCTTGEALKVLLGLAYEPDLVTLTAGGNDFLMAAADGADPNTGEGRQDLVETPLRNLGDIVDRLKARKSRVILNTIYDPTDGDDAVGESLGLNPAYRAAFNDLNDGIRGLARREDLILSDLEPLFRGHGITASDSWIVGEIEPNLSGATAIARHWRSLVAPRNTT